MEECVCCPRNCRVDRSRQPGYCGAGALPRVARAALHFWEEPMFSGTRGSGTVFFSGCSLRCIFCQNADISARQMGEECDEDELAGLFLKLEAQGRTTSISSRQRRIYLPCVRLYFARERPDLLFPYSITRAVRERGCAQIA
jgi:uncharacterized Fe-S radical SAM superfamily protein PflX